MRVARVLRKPPETFFFPGWMLLVVGGTLGVLVLMVVLSLINGPLDAWSTISDGALPRHHGQSIDASVEAYRVDVFASGSCRVDSWSPDRPHRIHIDRLAHWVSVRRVLRALRDAGVEQVFIVVRDEDGALTELRFSLTEPWPELDVHASAQDFVDAIG